MTENIQNIPTVSEKEKEKSPDYCYKIFQEVSGSGPETINETKNFFSNLPKLPENPLEAAFAIKNYLIDSGFEYDDKVFCMQEMLEKKRGNCLGLTLLIGAVLHERGFQAQYHIVSHSKDANSKKEDEVFEELNRGEYFDYDNPTLPQEQAEHPTLRFAPLEHPQLILGGKPFESTELEEREIRLWTTEAESVKEVTYEQVASYVYLDRARTALEIKGYDNEKGLEDLCKKCLKIYPENREAYNLLYLIGKEEGNQDLIKSSLEKYLRIGGDDSLFFYKAYLMTGDDNYLDKALEKFPAFVLAFMEKEVYQEKNPKEAKFNLAVAAWCVSNSAPLRLKDFYVAHEKKIIELFGKDKYDELILKLDQHV